MRQRNESLEGERGREGLRDRDGKEERRIAVYARAHTHTHVTTYPHEEARTFLYSAKINTLLSLFP